MIQRIEKPQRMGLQPTRSQSSGGSMPVSAPSSADPLSAIETRANTGPHAVQLQVMQTLLNPTQHLPLGGVAQLAGKFNYAGSKAKQYQQIIQGFQTDPTLAGLITNALEAGDLTLRTDAGDDTRYDRSSRTIYVASNKNLNQAKAAILFELNNAFNPHTYTDAAESGLLKMAEASEEPTGADYTQVATEMEKDEYVSLINYAYQVEQLKPPKAQGKALREKYEAVTESDSPVTLSYDKFVEQNLTSGHTLDLATAQHGNFTGGRSVFPEVPYKFQNPSGYSSYMAKKGTSRSRSQIKRQLESQEERGVNVVSSTLTDVMPAFDPSQIGATFHQVKAKRKREEKASPKKRAKTEEASSDTDD